MNRHLVNAKQETERLMQAMLPLAEKMLCDHGEFFPYGGCLTRTNDIVHVGAKGSTERPKSRELMEYLLAYLKKEASKGECRATAIVFDVRIKPPGGTKKLDAIQMNLEHVDGYSAEVIFPYSFPPSGELLIDKPFAQEGTRQVFS